VDPRPILIRALPLIERSAGDALIEVFERRLGDACSFALAVREASQCRCRSDIVKRPLRHAALLNLRPVPRL